MRIWPVILDAHPTYLCAAGRSLSLLGIPLGAKTVGEHLTACLGPATRRSSIVVSRHADDPALRHAIQSFCAGATVLGGEPEVVEAAALWELSDALLIVDPRYLPLDAGEFSRLIQRYVAERGVSHHLVALESAVAGTKESVSFTASGQVRRIVRHYERATWPFIKGVSATIVGTASGVFADGFIPGTLGDLRQHLSARGVPSRDVPINGRTFDLTQEAGLLAAGEHFTGKATGVGGSVARSGNPCFVGKGHSIDSNARITGPVVIHEGAHVAANAIVVGPAVIGAGARIASGAVITHAIVGAGCTVPGGTIVHNRVWVDGMDVSAEHTGQPVSYTDRLARLTAEARHDAWNESDGGRTIREVDVPFKRAFDIAVSALALTLLSPILFVIAIAVLIDSRGPILYGDEREGRSGRLFRCRKFRTMHVGAHVAQKDLEALDTTDGPHFKIASDPRVTRIGRFLRRLNLDELPQLFNVLSGEMSLVGPRPSPFRENQVCVPWREARLSVRPGITGFWQVCRHDRASGDFHQWIEYDLLYVQHISFWLDVKIIMATFATLGGIAGHVTPSWLIGSAPVARDTAAASEKPARVTAAVEQVTQT